MKNDFCLIFDMDGTLWDATGSILNSANEVLEKEKGWKDYLDLDTLNRVMGLEIEEIANIYFPELEQEEKMEIRGRDLLSGLPKTIEVNSVHIREALSEPVSSIIETIKQTLEATPPELAADVMEYGITLTGGGALLRGLDELITSETDMPVHVANEPLNCVAMGTGLVLEHIDTLKNVLISPRKALF